VTVSTKYIRRYGSSGVRGRCHLHDEGADVAHTVREDHRADEGDEDDEDALVVCHGCDVAVAEGGREGGRESGSE
jgi:hypothetical protein